MGGMGSIKSFFTSLIIQKLISFYSSPFSLNHYNLIPFRNDPTRAQTYEKFNIPNLNDLIIYYYYT